MAGIVINIDPTIFRVGGFSLRWYSSIIIVAVLAALYFSWREAKRLGLKPDDVTNLALWGIPGGIIGSKLVHVIDQLSYYLENPGKIIGGEGQAIYGAILGGALAAWIGSRVHRIPFRKFADLFAPGLIIAQAIGRLANIVNGDATGKPTDLPWAFTYTNPDTYAPQGVPTHPSPVYEIVWDLIVLAIVLRLRGRLRPDGSLFVLYLALYSVGRFFITFTRVNNPWLFGLVQAQLIALLILLVAVPWLVARAHWVKKEALGS
ncbi:MAG: prolipoprotein diacylglyceryl transferase [Chloroflexi bacterium]|nr:prolipoprotein diacylglyceryl transferase [Chloroflexota bacterium]